MKRTAFTLIELLISIVLFGLITVLLFGTIDNLRTQVDFYQAKAKHLSQKNRVVSLIRSDFDRVKTLTLQTNGGKNYITASLIGSEHSLYGIDHPYVVWAVLQEGHTLIRLESASPISLPIDGDKRYLIHSDIIGKECALFRIYDSSSHRLIYVKFDGQSPLAVETSR
ncbi:MAG: type II secretion system protein J [Sulfuricurvum sp.]|uniref:PulJ/GspJ family protein n=1 Tax=Sulfuricurvum sp. TaxID=2025608 RepID=UPI003D0C5B3E